MQVEFQLTNENLAEANKFFWQKAAGLGFNLKAFTISLTSILLFVVVVFFIGGYWSLFGFLVGAVIGLGLVLAFIKTAPKRFQPKNPNGVLSKQALSANKSGIEIKRNFKNDQIKWDYFLGFEETKNLFLLLIEPNQAVLVPKRAFKDKEGETFKALCLGNLKNKPNSF